MSLESGVESRSGSTKFNMSGEAMLLALRTFFFIRLVADEMMVIT